MSDNIKLTPFEAWTLRASDSQFHATAGSIGGIASGIVTCPLDVIKTKLQAQGGFIPVKKQGGHVGHPKMYNGLVGTARTIWRTEGIRGMYRGLGPIVMGYLPTWAVWFTVYNKSKNFLSQRYSMLRPAYRRTSAVPNSPRLRTTPPSPNPPRYENNSH